MELYGLGIFFLSFSIFIMLGMFLVIYHSDSSPLCIILIFFVIILLTVVPVKYNVKTGSDCVYAKNSSNVVVLCNNHAQTFNDVATYNGIESKVIMEKDFYTIFGCNMKSEIFLKEDK